MNKGELIKRKRRAFDNRIHQKFFDSILLSCNDELMTNLTFSQIAKKIRCCNGKALRAAYRLEESGFIRALKPHESGGFTYQVL